MEINTAMFARAGRMGYVLKPELLRRKGLEKDKDSLVRSIQQVLDIEVSSLRCVPPHRRRTYHRTDHLGSATSTIPRRSRC